MSKSQCEIMSYFYQFEPEKVILSKLERNLIWESFKSSRTISTFSLESGCPALINELRKSIDTGNLIQSAVFSECVYAQTLANMFGLLQFHIYSSEPFSLSRDVVSLIESYGLKPRYVYRTQDGRQALVQAGGFGGVDSALISIEEKNAYSNEYNIHTIEFKEAAAKTSEPDLPKYGEDGLLKLTPKFTRDYPQFKPMLEEQVAEGLNFFERMGSNINNFTFQSISSAVSENYSGKKYADVICTEDKSGYLTMMPANHAGRWSETRGEIRPAGRNKYEVWTPIALKHFILIRGGSIDGANVAMPLGGMITARARGGSAAVNRYKINPLFFVYAEDVEINNGEVLFSLKDVKQLKPTISAHMFFHQLEVSQVSRYYSEEL